MRIDVTKAEFEAIVDALKGIDVKSERKLRAELTTRLDWQLHPRKAPDHGGWAPIRIKSSWPSGLFKNKKSHWSFKRQSKPKSTKSKPPTEPLTADDILAEL